MTLYTQELISKRRKQRKEEKLYFMVQKSLGAALILLSMLLVIMKDPTGLIFFIPLGMVLILTKERIITI